jgi:hypothetical protein
MKFAISGDHLDYFNKHHAIEFEGLFNTDQAIQLVGAVDAAISARLGIRLAEINKQPPEKLFLAGRDLWRAHNSLKKIVTQNHFSEIAAQLTKQRTLRLGYDQLFPSPKNSIYQISKGPYAQFLSNNLSLNEISCLQGVVCGLMICLGSEQSEESEKASELQIFTPRPGNGVFFQPEAILDFQQLCNLPGKRYLMIVYTKATSVYILRQTDPNTNFLRQVGYSFGDKLSDKLNPILYRG